MTVKANGYTECVACKRPWRKRGQKVEDYPGTVLHVTKGHCYACYRTKKNGGEVIPPTPKPVACVLCHRPFRGHHEYIEDHPGTVQHAARGVCRNCYQKGLEKDDPSRPEKPLPDLKTLDSEARVARLSLDAFLQQIHKQGQKDRRRARQRMVIR